MHRKGQDETGQERTAQGTTAQDCTHVRMRVRSYACALVSAVLQGSRYLFSASRYFPRSRNYDACQIFLHG